MKSAFIAMVFLASTAAYADVPVTITKIAATPKKHMFGDKKDKFWLDIVLSVQLKEKVALLQTVKAKLACKAGGADVAGEAMVLGAQLDKLEAGAAKEDLHIRAWFDAPIVASPEKCAIDLMWGKSTKADEKAPIGAWCFAGGAVTAGACK